MMKFVLNNNNSLYYNYYCKKNVGSVNVHMQFESKENIASHLINSTMYFRRPEWFRGLLIQSFNKKIILAEEKNPLVVNPKILINVVNRPFVEIFNHIYLLQLFSTAFGHSDLKKLLLTGRHNFVTIFIRL
jgi:hypothetical protein